MSYVHQLREERKARLQRLNIGAPPKVKAIPISETGDSFDIPVGITKARLTPSVIRISADECCAYGFAKPGPEIFATPFRLHNILCQVALAHSLMPEDLTSHRRTKHLIKARFEFCYRAVTETTASLPQIGRVLNRDHTSILSAAAAYCCRNALPFPRGADWLSFKNRTERIRQYSKQRQAAKKAAQG